MKKIKILFLLLLAGGGLSHASVQKTLFSADVVASACHVVVDADGTGSSRLTFGTYRKSSAAPVPPATVSVSMCGPRIRSRTSGGASRRQIMR